MKLQKCYTILFLSIQNIILRFWKAISFTMVIGFVIFLSNLSGSKYIMIFSVSVLKSGYKYVNTYNLGLHCLIVICSSYKILYCCTHCIAWTYAVRVSSIQYFAKIVYLMVIWYCWPMIVKATTHSLFYNE